MLTAEEQRQLLHHAEAVAIFRCWRGGAEDKTLLVLADWLEEHDAPLEAGAWRRLHAFASGQGELPERFSA